MTHADGHKNARKIVTFDVQLVDSVTTDFHDKDPYQNCAAFTSDGTKIVTGGADGFIRLWKVSKHYERLQRLPKYVLKVLEVWLMSKTNICRELLDQKISA